MREVVQINLRVVPGVCGAQGEGAAGEWAEEGDDDGCVVAFLGFVDVGKEGGGEAWLPFSISMVFT
jgi:hypothetical protein